MSTCKQVKYVFEAFRRLRPGVPLRCLHGGMKQLKRMAAFYDFCQVGELGSIDGHAGSNTAHFPTCLPSLLLCAPGLQNALTA